MNKKLNRYSLIIEKIFLAHYSKGAESFEFERDELVRTAAKLKITLPKNLGDVIYSFRYRAPFPAKILATAPAGKEWVIRAAGRAKYRFALTTKSRVIPRENLESIKILDATPGMIVRYALSDEQALLAKLRYNRLLDIFTGVTCYSLQNHLRTTAPEMGQVEVDEMYVGVDQAGRQYVFPVQAKGGKDQINIVQIEQDLAVCENRYPHLICRAIAAQFIGQDRIALFELTQNDDTIVIRQERHYVLVPSEALTDAELDSYRN